MLAVLPLQAAKPQLKCHTDGSFKVMQFSDTQDDEEMDPRATALMEKLLDTEKPDMVVVTGDCIAGGDCATVDQVKQAISHVAYPMEKRKIPWAITFGNHDQEHYAKTKLSKEEVIKVYESYPFNMNFGWTKGIHGVGNKYILIQNASADKPVFALWLIDSGDYTGVDGGGYDWIHADQVDWYTRTSMALEKKYAGKVPGLMFFHIPLREFIDMTAAKKFTGGLNEPESPSKINGGMFGAVVERGDVKGIFVGHEHENNYVGEWMGVKLGYDSSIGYASYNLPDSDPRSNRTRGARVFIIKESDPWHFTTWMRFIDGSTDSKDIK